MRTSLLALLALPLLSAPAQTQGLERVAPRAERPEEGRLPDLLAREFRGEEWRNALAVGDLERRERNFEALLQRARLDPVARAFLEELARDPAAGELAWTARLALRELGRARFAPRVSLLGADPLGSAGRMEEALKELLGAGLPGAGLPGAGFTRGAPGGRGVRIEVVQGGGPEPERFVYEGESLEAILQAHPELGQRLGGRAPQAANAEPGGVGLERIDGPTYATPLVPDLRSAPFTTDKLGVIVVPLAAEDAGPLALEPGLGLEVVRVLGDSYAARFGLEPGAVLLELDGVALRKADDIERVMKARRPEAELSLAWIDALGQRQKKSWLASTPR